MDTQPTKRRWPLWMETLAGIMSVGIIILAALPIFAPSVGEPRRAGCQTNLKRIILAMEAYVQDVDEYFPPVHGNGIPGDPSFGWAGAVQPYLKSTQALQCPSEPTPPSASTSSDGFSDYWYNSRLANDSEGKLNYVSNTIVTGDGNDGLDWTDAAYSKNSLPENWRIDISKPAFRHWGGANYAFADGHVKWLKPNIPCAVPPSSTVFTFAVK